jgi:hypothetical protein
MAGAWFVAVAAVVVGHPNTHTHELSSTILRHPVNQSDGAFLSCSAPEIIVGVKSYNRSVAAFDHCDRLAPGWWWLWWCVCVCVWGGGGGRVVRKLGPCVLDNRACHAVSFVFVD